MNDRLTTCVVPMMAEWFQAPGVCPWSVVGRLVDVIGYLPVQAHMGSLYRGLTASIIRFRCFQPVPRWQMLRVQAALSSVGRTSVMSQVVGQLTPILEAPDTDTRHGEHEEPPCLMTADGIVTVGLQWDFEKLGATDALPPWVPDTLHLQERAKASERLKANYFTCRGDLPDAADWAPLGPPVQVASHHLNVHQRAFGGFILATLLDAWWNTFPEGAQPTLIGVFDIRFLAPVMAGDLLQVQASVTGVVASGNQGVEAHEITLLVVPLGTTQVVASCRVWVEGAGANVRPLDDPLGASRHALLTALTPDSIP